MADIETARANLKAAVKAVDKAVKEVVDLHEALFFAEKRLTKARRSVEVLATQLEELLARDN